MMQLFYYRSEPGNFGDDLNAWLWPRVIPDLESITAADYLVGIGTILDERLLTLPGRLLILGTGYRPSSTPVVVQPGWTIGFVRGPMTAAALGLAPDLALTDPGLLVATFRSNPCSSSHRVGFMPHFRTAQVIDCRKACERAGLVLVDPRWTVDRVLEMMASMGRILVESLHGAIVADALGIPWLRLKILGWRFETNTVSEFKWADWGRSMGVSVKTEVAVHLSCYLGRGGSVVNRLLSGRHSRQLASALAATSEFKAFQLSRIGKRNALCDRMRDRIRRAVGR